MIVIDMDMPKNCMDCPIKCIKFYPNDDKSCCPIKCDIEDIKAEIKDEMDDIACGIMAKYSSDEAYYNALGWALNVIDKHIGKEQE